MYQYTLKWDVVNREIKKGDKFTCFKSIKPDLATEETYTKGKTYISEVDQCITDNQGDKYHQWRADGKWGDWRFNFAPAPHPVETCGCERCWTAMNPSEPKDSYSKTCNSAKPDKDYFQSMKEEYGTKGDKRTFETGAVRDTNEGKPLIHTLLGYTRQRFGYHMAKNADKYGPLNFLKGIPTEAALESLDRHLAAYMAGDRSEDHLAAILFGTQCCMLNEKRDEGIEANHYFK